jgi:hypothetical protein
MSNESRVGSIPWLRIGAEALAIIASILIAFGIDSSWDRRQQKQEAGSILEGLHAEFTGHLEELNYWEETTEARSESLGAILALDDPSSLDTVATERLDTALYSLLNIADWDPQGGVLEAVISSGKLEIIPEQRLRQELASWPGIVADVLDNQHLMQNFGIAGVIPALSEKGMPLSRGWSVYRSRWPGAREADDVSRESYYRLIQDREIRALAATKYTFLTNSLLDIAVAVAKAELILSLAGTELERLGFR